MELEKCIIRVIVALDEVESSEFDALGCRAHVAHEDLSLH